MNARLGALSLAALALSGRHARQGQRCTSFTIPRPLPTGDCLVLGFLGGRARWDAENRWVRKTALALRVPGVRVETVENSKKNLAMRLIREAYDRNADGALDAAEARKVKLIVYGHSFGGAAVVDLAERLLEQNVPILLSVQTESVGFRDGRIPANVARAANLYQRDGWFVRGERRIVAKEPASTRLLGNWRYGYEEKDIDLGDVGWLKQLFQTAHLKMGNDSEVGRKWRRCCGRN